MNDANHTPSRKVLRRAVVAALFVGVSILAAGCGTSTPPSSTKARSATALPGTPAGAQARWLLGASARLPIPAAELAGHFDRQFLAQAGPAALNNALAGVGAALPGSGRVRIESISVDDPRAFVAELGRASGGARLTCHWARRSSSTCSTHWVRPSLRAARAGGNR